jgi:hypothetical protein
MSIRTTIREWGSTPEERNRSYPCDRLVAGPDGALFRAVDVAAPAEIAFRWLCQLRVAPYSYDRLDNRGRRSPQKLTPGLEQLEPGQTFMTIFSLLELEPGKSITLFSRGRLFGDVACTYRVDPVADARSRLVVKVLFRAPRRRPHGPLMRLILPPGDLLMMRRQLLNLAGLAEGQARVGRPPEPAAQVG